MRKLRSRIGVWIPAMMMALPALAYAGEPIDRTVAASAEGVVRVENISGTISVTGWDKDEVHVGGELGRDVEELIIEKDGGEVEIIVELPDNSRNIEDTHLEIRIPEGSKLLLIESVSANVGVGGVRGAVEIETVSGKVVVEADAAACGVETVSGSVDVTGDIAEVEVETVSGRIELREVEGAVEAETVSGAIVIDGGVIESLECAAVSGSMKFDANLTKDGSYEFENVSGSIRLVLSEDDSVTIDVETFSGGIDSEVGGKVRREKYGPGASLSTTLGDGDAEISVTTFSGSVSIEAR